MTDVNLLVLRSVLLTKVLLMLGPVTTFVTPADPIELLQRT